MAKRKTASSNEILGYLSGVMRGEEGSTMGMKAAELLGKRMGLFEEQDEAAPAPVIIDDLGDAPDG